MFDRGIQMDAFEKLFAEATSDPATVGTAESFGVDITDCSALRRAIHTHALPSTSVANLVIIGPASVDGHLSLLLQPDPF